MNNISKQKNKDRKIVIIGAGPGGLASAMLLARAGFEVTVLERRDRVGGRTSMIEQDGFVFDMGPTFFLYPEVLEAIFSACGRSLDREVELLKLDPHYRLVFGEGGEIEVTPDIQRMKAEIARLSHRDASRLDDYMTDNRAKLKAFKPVLEQSFSSLRDVM
jgi:phytoene desaturase